MLIETSFLKKYLHTIFDTTQQYLTGMIFCALLSYISIEFGGNSWLSNFGLSTLTIGILLGMILGNSSLINSQLQLFPGINFSKKTLLRIGIILYGFRLTTQDIYQVGISAVLIDLIMVCSTFFIAYMLGIFYLRLDRNTTVLIGAGSSICGAAAILATEPIVEGRPSQVTVAVSTVVLFGTCAIFIYPCLLQLNQLLTLYPINDNQFGIYVGSTIHEVAQVVATAKTVSNESADAAVITKMVRVMMLAPFLVLLSIFLKRSSTQKNLSPLESKANIIPWFAFFFIFIVLANSFIAIHPVLKSQILYLDQFLLTMAMTALGLTTKLSALKEAGIKPLILALILFIWLVIGGAIINRWILSL